MSSLSEACSHIEPDLVAYINAELSDEERAAVERHLAECPACSRDLEDFREAYRVARSLPVIEPSAAFRERLERAIADKVGARARMSVTGRRVSKRLATLEAARASAGGWAVYVSVSMAAVCAFLFVTQFVIFDRTPRRETYIYGPRARQMLADLKARRETPGMYDTILQGTAVDFSPVMNEGTVRLVGYYETAAPSERCVFAYDAIQWEDLSFRAQRAEGDERERLRGLIDKAIIAEVVAGELEIPDRLMAEALLHERELTVLPLRRRAEIWAARVLKDYLSRDFIFNIKIEKEAMEIQLFKPGISTT